VDLFAGIDTAAATIELFSGALFAIAFARRRGDVEHGIAALVSLAAAAHSGGSLVATWATGAVTTGVADAASWVGFVLTMPAAIHFALAYAGAPRRWGTLAAIYSAAAGSGLLDAAAARPASMSLVRAMAAAHSGAPRGMLGLATCCFAAVASVAVVAIVARAYLEGRREALAVVLGATVLLATAVNDLGVASGVLTTRVLVDVGLAGFVAGIASAQSARFAGVTRELERRTRDLRTRTSELGRSYEDLRAAQEELVKKEQLAVIGELAAVIAHEVRNPLAIIANAVAGLRKQAISRQDHETLLAILDEETSRLNRLVTDLLRYARPVSVQRSDFSLADVLDRALSLVSQDRRGIRTEMRVEGHDGRIWGDSNLLRQVFDNLVVNAVQAMGAGGTVTVRVRGATEDGVAGVAVDIIDTGEGMDTQVRTRARDPFFTTRPSGTGLGLAIVDRIVDAHGGRLAIDSRAGEGTTVTVFLPTGSPNGPLQAGAGGLGAVGPLEPHPAGAVR
jgi:signal transduction histidine kinase